VGKLAGPWKVIPGGESVEGGLFKIRRNLRLVDGGDLGTRDCPINAKKNVSSEKKKKIRAQVNVENILEKKRKARRKGGCREVKRE